MLKKFFKRPKLLTVIPHAKQLEAESASPTIPRSRLKREGTEQNMKGLLAYIKKPEYLLPEGYKTVQSLQEAFISKKKKKEDDLKLNSVSVENEEGITESILVSCEI